MTQIDFPTTSADANLDRQAEADDAMERSRINVGETERMITGAAGAALALFGVSRQSLPGVALALVGGGLIYRAAPGHCDAYQALGINTAQPREADGSAPPEAYFDRGIHIVQAFSINKSPDELYQYWRKLDNLPSVLSYLESVTVLDEKRSHWVARGPLDMKWEWDAEIINDEPNRLIAWHSVGNADVDNAGSVTFTPGPEGRGTEVKVVIDYLPTGGRFGQIIAKFLGRDPSAEVREGLRDFKRVMETGERPTIEGQSHGNCSGGGYRG
jgi:uncharacterized membrane protein